MYAVSNEIFDGPLDLLLSLIEKEKLDITAISLAKITGSYLDHIAQIEGNSSEIADFLVVAAKLLYLKSKELIPNIKSDEEEAEIADLEEKLREYQTYKNAARHLESILENTTRSFTRRGTNDTSPIFTPPKDLTATKLFAIFTEVLNKSDEETVEKVDIERKIEISLEDKREEIKTLCKKNKHISFRSILLKSKNKSEIIVTFLALLEMIKQKEIRVRQENNFADFTLCGVK